MPKRMLSRCHQETGGSSNSEAECECWPPGRTSRRHRTLTLAAVSTSRRTQWPLLTTTTTIHAATLRCPPPTILHYPAPPSTHNPPLLSSALHLKPNTTQYSPKPPCPIPRLRHHTSPSLPYDLASVMIFCLCLKPLA